MAAFVTAVVTAVQAAAAWVGSSIIGKAVFNIAASFLVSRLINKSANKSRNSQQGGRVQLPPQTNNRIPVVYGSAYVNGIITDARLISTDNKTNNVMYYCLVLSELTNTGTFSVNSIYWNDVKLVFESTSGNEHKVLKGVKTIDTPDDYEDLNFKDGSKNLVEIRVYAGNTESAQQIYPQSNKVNAYDYWPSDTSSNKYWNSATYGGKVGMAGLVFAIIRVEYNQEKGFTGLPNVTFNLNNSLNNPASVWQDFMTSNRYGANVNTAEIDTLALGTWSTYCDQLISGAKRYQINGVIDTNNPVKNNIDQILQNSAAWMSYDISAGLWRVYPQAPQAVSLLFNDDNIVGGIELTSTNLEDLYNELEVEYCDGANFDQRLFARDTIPAYDSANPSGTRHPNEPDNKLSMTLDLINNNVQALRVGRIQLKQTRDDLVIRFTASHVALQAQAGDVIQVKNSLYNWNTGDYVNGKPFRITRVKEMETQDGALVVEITAVEYNEDVYTEEPTSLFTPSANIGIRPITGISKPQAPTITKTESGARPKITVSGLVPAGVVTAMEFWLSFETNLAETARTYKLIRIERPSTGSTFTTGATISFDFDGLDTASIVVKTRASNSNGFSDYSDPSSSVTFIPKPAATTISTSTVLTDANGNPVPGLDLGTLLTNTNSALNGASSLTDLTDKIFETFATQTGFDLVAAAESGGLGDLTPPTPLPPINPSIITFTPTEVDYESSVVVTLTGDKFDPTPGANETVTPSLLINGIETAVLTRTNTQITFVLPARGSAGMNTIQAKVIIANSLSGTSRTGLSNVVNVESKIYPDLRINALYPPTRSRNYSITDLNVDYRTYLGSCYIEYTYDNLDPIPFDLIKGTGTASLYKANGDLYDQVNQDQIIIHGSIIELPFKARKKGTDYYVLMTRGIAVSTDNVKTPAINNNLIWTFTTEILATEQYVIQDGLVVLEEQ